jgi:hypothetical protein
MQKNTKNAISLVLFISIISLLIVTAGCGKIAVSEPGGLVEILHISAECSADNSTIDKCCQDQCASFCEENNYSYAKHITNVNSCGCWCD